MELFETTDFSEAFEGMDKNEDGQVKCFRFYKNWSFPFEMSLVKVSKSAASYEFVHVY